MISGIVYTSNSGYTAQYARLLGAALDLPVTDAKWGADPHPGRAVIYLGWLMAGKVQGYAKAAKEFDIRAVCAVGMGPASQAGAEKVRAKMGIPAEVPVFTLQGGFDINKLHGPYKWIMQLKCKEIRKTLAGKASLSPAQQLTYDMATKGASAAVSAVGRAVKGLLGKAACGVGKKVQKFIPPVCKVVMIVSGAVALLSCLGWLISRKKFA